MFRWFSDTVYYNEIKSGLVVVVLCLAFSNKVHKRHLAFLAVPIAKSIAFFLFQKLSRLNVYVVLDDLFFKHY